MYRYFVLMNNVYFSPISCLKVIMIPNTCKTFVVSLRVKLTIIAQYWSVPGTDLSFIYTILDTFNIESNNFYLSIFQ